LKKKPKKNNVSKNVRFPDIAVFDLTNKYNKNPTPENAAAL